MREIEELWIKDFLIKKLGDFESIVFPGAIYAQSIFIGLNT